MSAQSVYWQIWVDINNDNNFDETELLFQEEGNNQESTLSTILIPNEYPMGNYRMRVAMSEQKDESSCELSAAERDVKDFTLTVGIGLSSTESIEAISPIKIFPNPASKELFIDTSELPASEYLLELWNYEGKKLLAYNTGVTGQGSVLVDHLPPGLYAYRISGAHHAQTGRVVIQR